MKGRVGLATRPWLPGGSWGGLAAFGLCSLGFLQLPLAFLWSAWGHRSWPPPSPR